MSCGSAVVAGRVSGLVVAGYGCVVSSQVADVPAAAPVSPVLPAQVSIGVLVTAVPWFALLDLGIHGTTL